MHYEILKYLHYFGINYIFYKGVKIKPFKTRGKVFRKVAKLEFNNLAIGDTKQEEKL